MQSSKKQVTKKNKKLKDKRSSDILREGKLENLI